MSRVYTCTACNLPKTTNTTRGPVPVRCPECKGGPDPEGQDRGGRPRPVKKGTISTRPSGIAQQARVVEAIQLRLQYRTWSEIAEQLGWGGHAAVSAAVKREMERRRAQMDDSLDELRTREFDRLEALGREALAVLEKDHLVVNAGRVVFYGPEGQERPLLDDAPKLAAINTLIKVSESLRKLLGLDAASKVDAAVTVQYTIKGIPEDEMP